MQLAIIRKRYSAFGGAEQFIERLARELSWRGIAASVISDSWKSPEASELSWIRAAAPGLYRTTQYRNFLEATQRVLKLHRFDIVQSHERFAEADICRLGDGVHRGWLDRYSTTLPAWRRGWLKLDPFHRQMIALEKKMFCSSTAHFVANSQLVHDEAIATYDIDQSRISIIPNSIDTDFFRPASATDRLRARAYYAIPEQTFTICAVGSGFKRKGFFELISAIREYPDVMLIIAGKDRLEDRLRNDILTQGLEKRVKILGPVLDVRPIYMASDAFALPSLYDPSSNAVLEALASGLPIITTADVGTGIEILNANAGALCERTPLSIASAITQVQRQLADLTKNARELALRFSHQGAIDAWWNLYQQIGKTKT